MVFVSIGLPSRLAEWCDALLLRLLEHRLGSVQAVELNRLEDLAQAVIRTGPVNLVLCSRQPVMRLQSEIIEAGHPFLVALGDPRAALRHLVERPDHGFTDAARAVASSCAAMLSITKAPHALVITPERARDMTAVAATIAEHFQIPIGAGEIAQLVDQLADQFDQDEIDDRAWWDQLSERERSIINGALEPYIAQFAGHSLERLVWEPELFYTTADPPQPGLIPAAGSIDITGRVRFLVYGPFINLPPGPWSVDVVLGFSAEAAGMGFSVEIYASGPLAQTRVEATGEQVVEIRLHITIGGLIDQPIQIRICNERSAFDGRLALGYVALTPQPTIPEQTRQRLTDVLQR